MGQYMSPGQALVVRSNDKRHWITHGRPISIDARSDDNMLIDIRCIGARVLSSFVSVMYRSDHATVITVAVEDLEGSVFSHMINVGGSNCG